MKRKSNNRSQIKQPKCAIYCYADSASELDRRIDQSIELAKKENLLVVDRLVYGDTPDNFLYVFPAFGFFWKACENREAEVVILGEGRLFYVFQLFSLLHRNNIKLLTLEGRYIHLASEIPFLMTCYAWRKICLKKFSRIPYEIQPQKPPKTVIEHYIEMVKEFGPEVGYY